MNVITLGRAAGLIGDKLTQYPQYKIFKVDVGLEDTKTTKGIKKYSSPEEYENNCPSFKSFFKSFKNEDEVLFICVGSTSLTACSLKILEPLKDKKIILLYIRPDLNFLNQEALAQELLTFNVFQEYARSGILYRMYFFDNSCVENILGNLTISKFYERINTSIASTFHMINVFNHLQPLFEVNPNPTLEITRLSSCGIYDFHNEHEKMFFNLEYVTHKTFYFAFTKTEIEGNGSLIQKIKGQMRELKEKDLKINFKVFETPYQENIAFCEHHTHILQTSLGRKT